MKVVHTNLSEETEKYLSGLTDKCELVKLDYNLDSLTFSTPESVGIVICGYVDTSLSMVEVAQVLRMIFANARIYLVTEAALPLAKKDLLKNGFTDIFYFPLERELFSDKYIQFCRQNADQPSLLCVVKVNDVIELNNLSVDTYVYLQANDRYVPFNVSGQPLDEVKKAKLKEREVTNLYVAEEDLPAFYDAYAESIKAIQLSGTLSETEKRNLLKQITRELLSDVFTDSTGGMNTSLRVNESCKKIILSYMKDTVDVEKWLTKLATISSDKNDFHTRSANAMVASVLFGIGLNLDQKSIEALSVAALLHEIGHSQLPKYLIDTSLENMTKEEKEIFCKHPVYAVETLKQKKVVLPELAQKIILQQRERFDGTGYPNQISGKQLTVEAQILQLVDILLESVKQSPQKARVSIQEAFEKFRAEYVQDPSKCILSPQCLNQLTDLLINKVKAEEPKKGASSTNWSMS